MNKKIEKYAANIITFFIILFIGNTINKELEKQIPKELRVNYYKIFIEALFFGLCLGGIFYLNLKLWGVL